VFDTTTQRQIYELYKTNITNTRVDHLLFHSGAIRRQSLSTAQKYPWREDDLCLCIEVKYRRTIALMSPFYNAKNTVNIWNACQPPWRNQALTSTTPIQPYHLLVMSLRWLYGVIGVHTDVTGRYSPWCLCHIGVFSIRS
jgi:hypothetical protein